MSNVIAFPRGFRFPSDHPIIADSDTVDIEPDETQDMNATPLGGKALAYRLVNLLRIARQTNISEERRNQFRCGAANAIFQGLQLKRTDAVEYMLFKATFDTLCQRHFGQNTQLESVSAQLGESTDTSTS